MCENNFYPITRINTIGVSFDSGTNTLTFNIDANTDLKVNKGYNIIFNQTIPSETTIGSSIQISNGTKTFPVFTRKGNKLLTSNIINFNGLKTWFGNTYFSLRNFIKIN